MNAVGLIAGSVAAGVAGQMLLKQAMREVGPYMGREFGSWLFSAATSPYALAGLSMYVLALATWLVVLSRVELSCAYPMLGASKVLVVFLAFLVFGEPLTWHKIVGSSLVCAGIWLLALRA
ncbi:MAG: EamA family transporter [Bacillota bacterium]